MPGQPEPPRLALELLLGGARPRHHEAQFEPASDQRRERVEGDMKALLVDEPADEQDEQIVGLGIPRAQPGQVVDGRLQVARVDAVGDRGDP